MGGEPLIRRVVRTVLEWGFDAPVVVATDDVRVLEAAEPLGAAGALTQSAHPSGTHRVAEVVDLPQYWAVDTVLNVQGDLLSPGREIAAAALRRIALGDPVGTVGVPMSPGALEDRGRVKVVVDTVSGRARGFSRAVPAARAWPPDGQVLEHVGVYAYTRRGLRDWVQLPAHPSEQTEGLEQLRPLAQGMAIGVSRCRGPAPVSIDTERDLARAQEELAVAGHRSSV